MAKFCNQEYQPHSILHSRLADLQISTRLADQHFLFIVLPKKNPNSTARIKFSAFEYIPELRLNGINLSCKLFGTAAFIVGTNGIM
jgi:hypothetical protein